MIDNALVVVMVLFAIGSVPVLRHPAPLPHWIAAWSASAIGAAFTLLVPDLPLLQLTAQALGSLSAGLMLSGALLIADRRVPVWWLPATVAYGTLRAIVADRVGMGAGYGLGVVCEPAALLAAAAVTRGARARGATGLAERALPLAFLALAATVLLHLIWLATGRAMGSLLPVWIVAGPVVLGVQIQAAGERLRREVRSVLEAHVAERTAALAESEERHRAISEIASDFAFKIRMDPRGHLTREWISGDFEATLGFAREVIDGQGWRRLFDAQGLAEARADYREVRPGRPLRIERRIVGPDGRPRWIHLRITMQHLDAAGGLEVLGSARDVTHWKQAEAERERLVRRMEDVQRLDSLGILAGGIAHDFNNLLTVIRGSARLGLADAKADPVSHSRFQRITEAAEHAAGLTDQMLAYAGQTPGPSEAVDLGDLARSMADLLRASVGPSCALEFEIEEKLPAVEVARSGMRQVLMNLVINASEAIGSEPGTITVRVARAALTAAELAEGLGSETLAPGPAVAIEVCDDGCGMDEEAARRVFEPFFSTKFSGRGLGMAAVLGIVRKNGGVIRVQSEPGRGSCLRVLFAASDRTAAADVEAAARDAATGETGIVLIADDEDAVRELAREVLERAGFRVREARDGREALDAVRADPAGIGVVLLDLAMPDMSGEEAFVGMRAVRADLPVVLVSGYDPAEAAERFASGGLDGLLRKPWDPEALVAAVRRAAAGRAHS